jgi:hypothetical protein
MKYKVTGLIVCALIVIVVTVFSLSCEKNPVAPQTTSEDLTLKSSKTRSDEYGDVMVYDLAPRYNDQLRSIKVNGSKSGSYVVLYKDINYKGQPEDFIADDPNFDGWLTTQGNVIGNDKVSSVKLIGGATCTLYSNSRFGGHSITLTESCPNLKKKIRYQYYYDPPWGPKRLVTASWNDCASSIKVHNVTARGVVLYEHDCAAEYGTHPGKSTNLFTDLPYPPFGVSMIKVVNMTPGGDVHFYQYQDYINEFSSQDLTRRYPWD